MTSEQSGVREDRTGEEIPPPPPERLERDEYVIDLRRFTAVMTASLLLVLTCLLVAFSVMNVGAFAITGIGGFIVEVDTLEGNNVAIHPFPEETAACPADFGDDPTVAEEGEEAFTGLKADVEQIVIPADSQISVSKDIDVPDAVDNIDTLRISLQRGEVAFSPDYPPQAPRGPESRGLVDGSLLDTINFAGIGVSTGSSSGYGDLRFQRTRNLTAGETVPIEVVAEGTYDYTSTDATVYPVANALNDDRYIDGATLQSLDHDGAGSDGGYGDYTDLDNAPDNLSRGDVVDIDVHAHGTEPFYGDVSAEGEPAGDDSDSTIDDVFFEGISNTDASDPGGYADYTDLDTDDLDKGGTYNLEVSGSKVDATFEDADQQSTESIDADCGYIIYEFRFGGLEWTNDDETCYATPADGTGIHTDAISPGSVVEVTVETEEDDDGSITYMWVDWHGDGFDNAGDRHVIGAIAPEDGRETHTREVFVPTDAEPGTASIRLMTAYLGEEGQDNYAWDSQGSDCTGADGEDYSNCEGQVIDWTAHINPTSRVTAFFDWNHDGTLDERVQVGESLDKSGEYTYDVDVEVPEYAKSGSSAMRLMHRNDIDILEPLPQSEDYVGEAHDYRVDVTEMRTGSSIWAYVDWNQDGSFGDPQHVGSVEDGGGDSNYGDFTASGEIDVPPDAAAGATTMRVVHQQDGWETFPPSADEAPGPDETTIDGEYHDYTVHVDPDASYITAWAAWDVEPGDTVTAGDFEEVADFGGAYGYGTTANVGPFTREDEITVPDDGDEPEEQAVAVGDGGTDASDTARVTNALQDKLDGTIYTTIDQVDSNDMAANPGNYVDQYDVIVINGFDDDQTSVAEAENLIDEADAAGTPLVFLHNYWDGSAYTGAVVYLAEAKDDPDPGSLDQGLADTDIYFEIQESHPIWGDVGSEGDIVRMYTEGEFGTHAWWWDYSGTRLADVHADGGSIGGGASVQDDHCLLSLGATTNEGEYTDAGEQVIANCVELLAEPDADRQGARLLRLTHKQGTSPPQPEGTNFRGETLDVTMILGPPGDISDDGNLTLGDASFTVSNLQAEELSADGIVIDETFTDNTPENPKFGPDGELQLEADAAVMEDVRGIAHNIMFAFFEFPNLEIELFVDPDDPHVGFSECPVAEPPEGMVVDITGTNEEGVNEWVEEGETLEVYVEVWNNDDVTREDEVIDLFIDGEVRDEETVTLDPDQTTNIVLEWNTQPGDAGEYDALVRSADHIDQVDVEIVEEITPPDFQVEITSTNSPVRAGLDTLEVDVEIYNDGHTPDTQDIELDVDGLRDVESVYLDAFDDTEITLEWETEDGDDGDYTAIASSDDDSDSEPVTVNPPEPATFEIVGLDSNSPIAESQELRVFADIENTGDLDGEQDVELHLDPEPDGETNPIDVRQDVFIESGDTRNVELNWTTEDGDAGSYDAEVRTDNDTDSTPVEVEDVDPPFYDVVIEDTETVEEGMDLDVTANITNTGEVEGFQDIELEIEERGEVVDVHEDLLIEPGDFALITLTWETEESDAGDWTANVSSDDDFDTELVTVQEGTFGALLTDVIGEWHADDADQFRTSAGRPATAPGDTAEEMAIGYVDGTWDSETQPTDGLEIYYRMDGTDPDNVYDYSGFGRHGFLQDTEPTMGDTGVFGTSSITWGGWWGDGGFNYALNTEQFAGDLGIDGNNPRSLSTWVNVEGGEWNNPGAVFSMGGDGRDAWENFNLRLECTGTYDWIIDTGDGTSFDECDDPRHGLGHTFPFDYQSSGWIHLVVVFDGSEITVYADGQEVAEFTDAASMSTTNDWFLRFGEWFESRGTFVTDDSYAFPGSIEEPMVFSRALTQAEVEELYFDGMDGEFHGLHDSRTMDARDEDGDVGGDDNVDWREIEIDATVPADTEAWINFTTNIGDTRNIQLEDGVNTYDVDDEWDDSYQVVFEIDGTSVNAEESWEVDRVEVSYRVW